jgi:hypothetical protein
LQLLALIRLPRPSRISIELPSPSKQEVSFDHPYLSRRSPIYSNLQSLLVVFNFSSSISTSANMRTSRFQSLSLSSLRTSLRRSSSTSNGSIMSSNRDSYASNTSSPISTINAIMHRQSSMLDMEEERRSFGSGLEILEPRPLVYWGGLEERMGSL